MRYILGAVDGLQDWEFVQAKDMPELDRYILHRLHELEVQVRQAYEVFDYKRLFALLTNFMTVDLSAFYFDIRKDSLYCDAWSSGRRRSCREDGRCGAYGGSDHGCLPRLHGRGESRPRPTADLCALRSAP
jgi:isoleucyl-tRNA synthetase